MNKALITTLLILSISLLSACSSGYTADRSYMTQEQRDKEQQKLDEAVIKYEKATTDTEKNESALSIGLRNMNLGNYDEAIKYYKKVIENEPNNFAALNNLEVMYEEMGEIAKAIEYVGILYNYYTDNPEVNSDFVNLLIKNKQFVEATRVVEAFKKTEKAKGNEAFIKGLEDMIAKASQQ